MTGYLRPETAQGIFVNFKRLMDFNGGQLPFAAGTIAYLLIHIVATIGQAFRNEIAPRSGLLRVREFTLAEIEHFMNPAHSNVEHPKLSKVKNVSVPFLSRDLQAKGAAAEYMTVADALSKGILQNTTLAYFIGMLLVIAIVKTNRSHIFVYACIGHFGQWYSFPSAHAQ